MRSRWMWVAAAAGIVVLVLVVKFVVWDPAWVEVATPAQIADGDGVFYEEELEVFLVDTGEPTPLALSALSPHSPSGRELVRYCETSGLFEAEGHGEKFDRFGYYYAGPAPRGLDRVAVKVEDGLVYVDPGDVTEGPARDSGQPQEPTGPFCDA